MTPELQVLAYAVVLQATQFALMSISANLDLGPSKTLSARDESHLGGPLSSQLSDKPARLYRAMNNHFEALILYTAAVVVVVLGDKTTGLTAICAWTYLAARILYVPAYYFGWAPWRSLIWFTGFLATLAMVLSTWI
ncbi:MAPEG family protein [Cognatiyoonia sediminum]|uniref:MAPEG family protein n=1 Tax=Cognatiyoonia sediminum TaxID=1508389 RepID=A0A1M5NLF1_9RHOB|nr:MAPEG family protein [Cognatiyoonia sediminum]SHG90380.1 MAPEG family protein [Cognatiyoonia sediminum]